MQLSGSERKELRKALVDAYRTPKQLRTMVNEELGENLEAIAGGDNLNDIAFELIQWAEARSKIHELILAASVENSENTRLKNFCHNIAKKLFILNPGISETTVTISPNIEWLGTTEDIQLENWLQAEQDWYDAIFLKRAVENFASVCKVEIPSQNITGTGVLIAKNFVLTNYHVLTSEKQPDIYINAHDTILRFGYLGSDSITEKVFKLDREKPIVSSSPAEEGKLDYVLLQVEESIMQTNDIKPANYNGNNILVKGQGINILQHPKGETLKVSLTKDGITGVDEEKGLVEYVSRTDGGSSGSPCFDESWNLVALHHAQINRLFGAVRGSIRQGILFNSIYEEIKSYL
ncbi:MAG: trypsin-like peptidase domain-containing protein [Dolichospermum sp. LBC05a]|nr:trypsin-like peptidase domain-containing protein [Dolichospermum sp. OL01]MCO5798002.1 trypsin-like peptidase domain-containing protein [Dolichospermum sp. OL03]MCS6281668.1 trypsin-like peptidase domain-containing protein [Dolichospermum sp.]QSV59482.1 MAG: trypsin-like peptidase domain-containing protein [Dolichospermum sp. LBC05a]